MKKRVTPIDAKDIFRVLDTEVLPYEVPVWFSNKLFKRLCRDQKLEKKASGNEIIFFKVLRIADLKLTRPFEYAIAKNDDEMRTLGIMHPYVQLEVVDFYEKYGDIIPYYCSQSKESLRFPYTVAKSFRSTDDAEDEERELAETPGRAPVEGGDVPCITFLDSYCSSYYVYKRINFFYKFYESYEFHKLEKRFLKYAQVDVSKCFSSIYTHSLCWAIKGKEFAKEFMHSPSFEKSFDVLMQEMNYKETHGILIGPEISRIFAEIIFQRIDRNTIDALLQEHNFKRGIDYEYRRYVDDYVIFYNEEKVICALLQKLKKYLAEYKMYLNESKTQYQARPFISNISICKMALKDFLTNFYDKKTCNEKLKYISNAASYANTTIVRIKGIIKSYPGVTYKSISGFLLSEFSKRISYFLKKSNVPDENSKELLLENIIVDLDVIFFILSMDLRVRTTDIVTRIVLNIVKCEHFLPNDKKMILHKKIFDLCHNLFDVLKTLDRKIEQGNLLLLLSVLSDHFELQEEFVKTKIFDLKDWDNYFVWMSLMLYCRGKDKYKKISSKLVEIWKEKISNNEFEMKKTEDFLFFLDTMSCPYLLETDKVSLIQKLRECNKIICKSDDQIRTFLRKAQENNFYIDWKNCNWLFEMSKRKMYIFPYE